MTRGRRRLSAPGLEDGGVPDAGKEREFRIDPFGKLDSHFFLDIRVFLTQTTFTAVCEPAEIRLDVILVLVKCA